MESLRGISLVEIVIVIVSLGIFSVIAIPKFIDLWANANIVTTKRYANALTTASAVNYTKRKENQIFGRAVQDCTDIPKILTEKKPRGYVIIPKKIPPDETITCTLNGPKSTTAIFKATGVA